MTQDKKLPPPGLMVGAKTRDTDSDSPSLSQAALAHKQALAAVERFQRKASKHTAMGRLLFLNILPPGTVALREVGGTVTLVRNTGELWRLGPKWVLNSPSAFGKALFFHTGEHNHPLEMGNFFTWRNAIVPLLWQAIFESRRRAA